MRTGESKTLHPFYIFTGLLVLLVTARWIIPPLLNLPHFGDEIVNIEAAARFFTELNFTSHAVAEPFDPRISTGIASAWAGGVGWLLTHELVFARLASVLWSFCLVFFSAYFYFRSLGRHRSSSFVGGILVWALVQKIPYFSGYIYNLGELNAAALIALGAVFYRRFPFVSSVLMGVGVWMGKFIYLPIAGSFILASLFSKWSRPAFLKSIAFLLPFAAWWCLIVAQFGFDYGWKWLASFVGFLKHGNSGVDSAPRSIGLVDRLQDTRLEWVHYEPILKLKILVLLFSAFGVSLFFLIRGTRRSFSQIFSGFSIGLLLFYSTWYFLWHPFMWIRHLQPVLYFAFTILFVSLSRWILSRWDQFRDSAFSARRFSSYLNLLAAGLGLMIAGATYIQWRESVTEAVSTGAYAPKCVDDLNSLACSPVNSVAQ